MDQGVHYTNAHYQHANTETIVGHVSLATGTVPAAHGMVGNVWFDRQEGRLTYNIEDPGHHLLTAGADVDAPTEIDPTQKAAKVDGRSPATILSSTFSDELGEELIEGYFHPYLYLNRDLIQERGLDQAEVEKAVAAEPVEFDGVAAAVSSTALRTASLPDTLLMRAILRNFHPKRSGDIYVVFEPNVFINDFDGLTVASTHGSAWRYDTFVPVIFAGAQLKARTVSRPVTPYDVAPTLANYLGVKPPSGSIGNPLVEIVGD